MAVLATVGKLAQAQEKLREAASLVVAARLDLQRIAWDMGIDADLDKLHRDLYPLMDRFEPLAERVVDRARRSG